MSVLLTGAAGFVGSRVARALLDEGCEVYAWARGDPRGRLSEGAAGLRLETVDLRETDELAARVARVRPELCIHCAWYAVPGRYLSSRENAVHVRSGLALARALAAAGCGRLVGVGTCFEYDTSLGALSEESPTKPATAYARSKLKLGRELERLSGELGLSVAWARLFYLYGPFEDERRLVPSVITSLLEGRAARTTKGEQIRDFLHVDDVAAALWAIARADVSGPVNVGSGSPITVRELVLEIGRGRRPSGADRARSAALRSRRPDGRLGRQSPPAGGVWLGAALRSRTGDSRRRRVVARPGDRMTSTPLVSVGVPTRNRAAVLPRAVESVLAQDWPELELVICDNASTDETESLCRSFEQRDARVRYVRQPEDIGAEANFRDVLARARGELFMWLADDDWVDPAYVSECARVLLANPDHALVAGRTRFFRSGELAFAEREVNLLSASPTARVAGFYRTVTMNGAFYGLVRREQVAELPLRSGLGFDWLRVASLAYLGKVRTLGHVSINRSIEGVSRDSASLAGAFGLTRRQAASWHLVVARAAYDDIRRGPVYRSLGARRRTGLALASAAIVVARFSWKVWLGWVLARVGAFERARGLLEKGRRRRGQLERAGVAPGDAEARRPPEAEHDGVESQADRRRGHVAEDEPRQAEGERRQTAADHRGPK